MEEKANEFLRYTASGTLAFPVTPRWSSERLAAQQGLFLFPCDPARTLHENLDCLIGGSEVGLDECLAEPVPYDANSHNRLPSQSCVLKLVLASKERLNAQRDLHSMNIHEASLFPGVDGFARSLAQFTWQG